MQQFTLFPADEQEKPVDTQEWGTFKDSLRAPIHNWFTYPAGFSYKAVESSLRMHGIQQGQVIYDPFMGSGTTNLVAKKYAINSYGVEAHPFVFRITRTKLNWDIDLNTISNHLREVELLVRKQKQTLNGFDADLRLKQEFPELVLKCFAQNTLLDLLLIRNAIHEGEFAQEVRDIFFVGLTSILRQVSTAATGWPYIAPNKQKTTSLNKDALQEFVRQVHKMAKDISVTIETANPHYKESHHQIFNADSRDVQVLVPDRSIDHVFTSPPYLNNFDYADRTRLELYFWGEAKNWNEISKNIRTRLITSATTQIARDDPKYDLSDELRLVSPDVHNFLRDSVHNLSQLRLGRGGKKSYDHLVSGYFNDMLQIISEVFRVLKHNTQAVFVLGDSAPYGVHIPTDELIGKIGLGVGFSQYRIDILRERGGKWKDNPQRHDQALRESIVTLTKA
jgi:DNA modification methylase